MLTAHATALVLWFLATDGLGAQLLRWLAPSPEPASFVDRWSLELEAAAAAQQGHTSARLAVHEAADAAAGYLVLARDPATLRAAVDEAHRFRFDASLELARAAAEFEPDGTRRARAHAVAAWAATSLRRFDLAAAEARAFAELGATGHDEVAAFVLLWGAAAALETGDAARAAAEGAAAAAALPHPFDVEASFIAARAGLLLDGARAAAAREAARLLASHPEYPAADRLAVEIAAADAALGHNEAAAARLDALLWSRPYSPHAPAAQRLRDTLREAGVALPARSVADATARGRELRRARHWDRARDVLVAAAELADARGASDVERGAIEFELALNAYDSASFDEALQWLDALEARGGGGVSAYDRSTWRGRSLSRLGRVAEAFEVHREHWQRATGSASSPRLLEVALDYGLWAEAYAILERQNTRDRDWQSWQGAFVTYMVGRYARAAELFAGLARTSNGDTQARYLYWQAKSELKAGEPDRAVELFTDLAEGHPQRYYGMQAASRLYELREATPQPRPARLHWRGPDGPPTASLGDLGLTDPASFFRSLPASMDAPGATRAFAERWGALFPDATVAAALVEIGAREPARLVFRDVGAEFRGLDGAFSAGRRVASTRPIALTTREGAHTIDNRSEERGWWGARLEAARFPVPSNAQARAALATRQLEIRDNRSAIRASLRDALRELDDVYWLRRMALSESLPPLTSTPRDPRWHEVYPHAYGERLRPHAEAYGLNPYVLWGLMIVESDMNPDTISRADAYGLLQVIPKTGDLVASALGDQDFGAHQLLDPGQSLRFGAWYFAELLKKFRGQEIPAMVAYNAGPHQVQRWLQWRGTGMDMDEFLETVPFDGARRYPQKILRYMALMRVADGLDGWVYMGNLLDPVPEDNIYY